jgi:hypothetical protein
LHSRQRGSIARSRGLTWPGSYQRSGSATPGQVARIRWPRRRAPSAAGALRTSRRSRGCPMVSAEDRTTLERRLEGRGRYCSSHEVDRLLPLFTEVVHADVAPGRWSVASTSCGPAPRAQDGALGGRQVSGFQPPEAGRELSPGAREVQPRRCRERPPGCR